MRYGDKLRELREASGYSVRAMACEVDSSSSHYARTERSETSPYNVFQTETLLDALGVEDDTTRTLLIGLSVFERSRAHEELPYNEDHVLSLGRLVTNWTTSRGFGE